jgi:hypothetical protein
VARSHAPLVGPGQPIELPHAVRAAAPFAVLAVLAALLLLVPDVPWEGAAIAAVAFGLAAAARAAQQHRALRQIEASVDRILLRREPTPVSPLLSWRMERLRSPEARERLTASLRRIERSASASSLAGASPLNRPAIRASHDELEAVVDRLAAPDPVNVRGILLVQRLLDDPAGPLYGQAPPEALKRELRRALDELCHTGERAR